MSEKYKLGPVTAYGIAVEHGFQGTEQEWLDSLHPTDAQINAYFEENPAQRVMDGSVTRQKLASDVSNWIAQIQAGLTDPFTFKGIVEDTESLPESGNTVNDTYYVEEENAYFSWNGEGWFRSGPNETQYLDRLSMLQKAVTNDIGDLGLVWEQGQYSTANGNKYSTTKNCRDGRAFETTPGELFHVFAPAGLRVTLLAYDTNGDYLNKYAHVQAATVPVAGTWTAPESAAFVRIMARLASGENITTADCAPIVVARGGAFLWNALRRGGVRTLALTEDVDDVIQPGVYFIPTGFPGSPVGPLAMLEVDTVSGFVFQRFTSGKGVFFRRRASTGEWTTGLSDGFQGAIKNSDDFNNITARGYYLKSVGGTSVPNQPTTESGWLEVFGTLGNMDAGLGSLMQRFTTNSMGKVFTRYRSSGGSWGDWFTASGQDVLYTAEEELSARIARSVRDVSAEWITTNGKSSDPDDESTAGIPGFPIAGAVITVEGVKTWDTYRADTPVSGLPYSAVVRYDNDIFYNRSITTFHSAARNPLSVLYTTWGGTPENGLDGIQCATMGCVCSTFASAAVGSKAFHTSAELIRICGDPVDITDIGNLLPGMLILISEEAGGSGEHSVLVKSVQTMTDGSVRVVVIESVQPVTRERTYTEKQIRALLDKGYHVYQYPGATFPKLELREFAEDVITEYGCDTWYPLYSSGTSRARIRVWLAPEAGNVLYYRKKDTTDWLMIDGLTKNVLSDITAYLDSTGTWQLTTNAANAINGRDPTEEELAAQTPVCTVIVADTGTAAVEDGDVILSGYEACRPSWYMILAAGEGYTAKIDTSREIPESQVGDSRTVIHPPEETEDFKLRVFYDTGFGSLHMDVTL